MSKKIPSDGVLRLIPQRKKNLLKLIFSRLFLMIVLILMQIGLLFVTYFLLNEIFPYLSLILSAFSVVMIFYLFNCEMDSTAKLTWLIIIMIFPIPGTIFLFLTQKDVGHHAIKRRVAHLIKLTSDRLETEPRLRHDRDLERSGTDDLCRYLNRTGCFPIYDCTETRYFSCGEEKFIALLEELEKAEKFIFMEYFIIDEGEMWGSILEVLRKKAAQGVDVRVIYDGMCEMSTLTHDYPKRLAELGIKCKAFAPIMPFLSTYYNYRDHRKILVIDGETAFTGGVNLADEYINRRERFGHWKDAAIMLRGSAAASFTLMFLQMWNIDEHEPEWDPWLDPPAHNYLPNGYVMPYADCPLDEDKVGENVYMDILNRATDYVWIMTPYLILDGELQNSLIFAAKRGIDVRIVLPGIPDKKSAFALAKTHYTELTRAGVRIYEYSPGFIHSKVFVCDGEKAVVGTINLDYRSLYHHFECAVYMYRTDCIGDIEKDFRRTFKKCRKITPETIKNEKLSYKIAGQLMKLIAPLF